MATAEAFEEVLQQCQIALGEFPKGNPEPMKMMFSHQQDVSLANPLGPPCAGGMGLPRSQIVPHRR